MKDAQIDERIKAVNKITTSGVSRTGRNSTVQLNRQKQYSAAGQH
jgi:hypothetical protein